MSEEEIEFLRSTGRLGGFAHTLKPYLGNPIKYPDYWNANAVEMNKFQRALATRFVA